MILSIILVCGVAASLAVGVLLAYALCVSMFALFRIHARKAATARLAAGATLRTVRH